MDANLILPLSIVMSTVSYSLVAIWYVAPWLRRAPLSDALSPFLLFHSFRHIGMAFLIAGVTSVPLDTRFAHPAAYGDLLAAFLAFAALIAVRRQWGGALPLVWIFNLVGTADLVNALYQGFRYTPNGALGATYFIPAVIVPALLVMHVIVFALLAREGARRKAAAVA